MRFFTKVGFLFGLTLFSTTGFSLSSGFEGEWNGQCEGKTIFGLRLKIGNPSKEAFDWIIQYQGQPSRNYTMKQTEDAGVFVLDENNGIKITGFEFNNCLIDTFSARNIKINSKTCLEAEDRLVFEVMSSEVAPYSQSSSETLAIQDHKVFDFYKCVLTK